MKRTTKEENVEERGKTCVGKWIRILRGGRRGGDKEMKGGGGGGEGGKGGDR